MAINDLQFNPQLNPNYSYHKPQFGSLTAPKAQTVKQAQPIEAQKISRGFTTQELEQADKLAQSFAPVEEEGFFEGLIKDIKDLFHSAKTMFAEPTEEETAQAFQAVDSYSALRPEQYYRNVDSNKELVPVYDEDIYQLVA